jgi:hypothetical protein
LNTNKHLTIPDLEKKKSPAVAGGRRSSERDLSFDKWNKRVAAIERA